MNPPTGRTAFACGRRVASVNCAFVGAGAVAEKYAAGFSASPLSLQAVCDRRAAPAEALADTHDAAAYTDLSAMLDAVDCPLVVNLTSHAAHAAVTETCLQADRHVFSEKPLALDPDRARDLLALAERRDRGLGCAPIAPACDAQQHARRLLTDGRLGTVGLCYAHAHVGRVTEWHDRPESFLDVGPLYDGAVYPLSVLVDWFGPVERVRSADAVSVWPERESRQPDRPPHVEATLGMRDGPTVRLTASLYASHRSREWNSLEVHGDDGALYLDDSGALAAERDTVAVRGGQRAYTHAPHPQPRRERRYLWGVERLVASLDSDDPGDPRSTARRGAHIVAVCDAIERAAEMGASRPVPAVGVAEPTRSQSVVRPPQTRPANAAVRLPPMGVGCSRYRDGEYVDRIDSIATALDAGYRLLDSAELYGNEARIGALLDRPGTPDRDALFLASKVWNTNHEHVREACTGTLDELGVATLDCYLLHWPTAWAYQGPLERLAETPPERQEALAFPTADGDRATADVSLADTWARLEALVDDGLARTLGICNVDREGLAALVETARIPPAVVQIERHPYRPRRALVDWCHERGIRVVAHSPLSAPGLLEDPVLASVAAANDATPAQVALAWHRERGVVPIPGSNDPEHIVENLAATRLRLDADAMERLDDLADPDFER
jgi:alcohol dehydrogenase (NADP+)